MELLTVQPKDGAAGAYEVHLNPTVTLRAVAESIGRTMLWYASWMLVGAALDRYLFAVGG